MTTFGLFDTDQERVKAERIALLHARRIQAQNNLRRRIKGAYRAEAAISQELYTLEHSPRARPQLDPGDRRFHRSKANAASV